MGQESPRNCKHNIDITNRSSILEIQISLGRRKFLFPLSFFPPQGFKKERRSKSIDFFGSELGDIYVANTVFVDECNVGWYGSDLFLLNCT